MKNAKKILAGLINLIFLFFCFFSLAPVADAQKLWNSQEGMGKSGNIGSLFLGGDGDTDVRMTVVYIIRVVLELMALFFTVLIILGGFRWMNSRGNGDEVEKAKDQIKNAVIGLVIVASAFAITTWVVGFADRALRGDV